MAAIYNGRYRVSSPFGWRTLSGVRDNHRGIDVVGGGDKHICCVAPGYVGVSTMVQNRGDGDLTWQWGNYVRVDGDDGRKYYYCHMSRRLVSAGQRVRAGDHLGIEGNTGYSFGSHCHFEVREGGVSIDPAPYLGIPNAIGEYGRDYRAAVKQKFALSDATMRYLDGYKYAADLYRRLLGE